MSSSNISNNNNTNNLNRQSQIRHHQFNHQHHNNNRPTASAAAVGGDANSTAALSTTSNSITAGETAASSSNIDTLDLKILENIEYPFCTDHSKYEHIAKIGQGTFGEVYKAKCRKTQEIVALKKVLTENEKEGFPITALREIKILQVLHHENIVKLIEICTTKATAENKYKSHFYLVFEFCEHDLAGLLLNQHIRFSLGEQKRIMQQLLNGIYYIHKNFILHRDMKTANILMTKDGKLKLADFGLARAVEPKSSENKSTKYTNRVVTLWYRPPELLLGERCYTKAIDIWGAGCIMAELWTREPILKGNSEQTQLDYITNLCGSIEPSVWPDVDKLELFNKMILKQDQKRRIKERMGPYVKDQQALDLLDKLLTLDPKKRIDSDEALDHDFFWSEPLPTDLKLDKINQSNFEFTSQAHRRQMNRQNLKPIGNEQHHDRVY